MLKQLILFSLLIIFVFVVIYFLQRQFIYFPSQEKPDPTAFHAEDMQVVEIPVTKQLTLNSWYKPALPEKPVILYLHGNAGHIGYRMPLVRDFLSAGFGVLLLEYRGYGGNPGKPTEAGLYEDGRAAMKYLHQQGITNHNIVLYGESLGTGVATKLATEFPVCALVLQSPYTSFSALARYHYFWLPVPVTDKYDSLSLMPKVNTPVLMLHGKLDVIVPYAQGLTLFQAANQPKEWVEFPTKGHHNLWNKNYADVVINFINTHCKK